MREWIDYNARLMSLVLMIFVSVAVFSTLYGCGWHKQPNDNVQKMSVVLQSKGAVSPGLLSMVQSNLALAGDHETVITEHDADADVAIATAKAKAEEEEEKKHRTMLESIVHFCIWNCPINVDTKPDCDQACCDRKAHQQRAPHRSGVAAPKPVSDTPAVVVTQTVNNPAPAVPSVQPQQQEQQVPVAQQQPPAPSNYVRSLNGVDMCLQYGPEYPGCAQYGPVDHSVIVAFADGSYGFTEQYRGQYREQHHHELPREPREHEPRQPEPKPTPRPGPSPVHGGPTGCGTCQPNTGVNSGSGVNNGTSGNSGGDQGSRSGPDYPSTGSTGGTKSGNGGAFNHASVVSQQQGNMATSNRQQFTGGGSQKSLAGGNYNHGGGAFHGGGHGGGGGHHR